MTQIGAGLWLSDGAGQVPPEVIALQADPGRMTLVVAAPGPDQRTDELVEALFPLLAGQTTDVRLVLSGAADRYVAAARGSGLSLIAADDAVVITPYGYALVRPAGPGRGQLAQWRSYLADGGRAAAGVLSPSPRWEQDLPAVEVMVAGAMVRRVPAGLAILACPEDPVGAAGGELAQAADAVWPDPDRITIVAGPGEPAMLRDALAELLPQLPLRATDGVRLYWPRAGAGPSRQELREVARRCGTDLIAPAADLRATAFGAVCCGPAGAAPWTRLTSAGDVKLTGSLLPVPAWELGLAEADLDGLGDAVSVEHIAAGLCLYRTGQAARGFVTTARCLLPDPGRLTMVVSGAASDSDVRQDVEAVLDRISKIAGRRMRLLLTGAGAGAGDAFGQQLADKFGGEVLAPVAGWTATPDGRPIALPARGEAPPARWQLFLPRPDEPATGPVEPDPAAPQAKPELTAPVETADEAVTVVMLPRDYSSSARDRQLYRESAARYQSHVVAVRRVLTQRPGLRAVASGEAEDAVVTDFAAVLDFMADDRQAATAALREGSAGSDPRVACVISGFRRLPSFTGAVFTSAFLDTATPGSYVPGAFLVEPAFVLATSSHVVALDGDIDYVIWSQTGKRLAALVADAARDEIVFPAGTAFRVLAIYVPAERDERALAFLRESALPGGERSTGQPSEPFDEMDRRVLERLGAAATLRNGVRPEDRTLSRPAASGPLLIGLDGRGVPFRGRTDG